MRENDIAFPANQILHDGDGNRMGEISHSGLTKLEYIATHVLAAARGAHYHDRQTTDKEFAIRAVEIATALIREMESHDK